MAGYRVRKAKPNESSTDNADTELGHFPIRFIT